MTKPSQSATASDYLLLFAAAGFLVGALLVWVVGDRSGGDSSYYLLSTIAQSLAAIVALSVSLSLAYSASTKYVAGVVHFVVRSHVFLSYVLLNAVAITLSLVGLEYHTPPVLLSNLSLALCVSCLASIVPFMRWISHAYRPESYVNQVLMPEYLRWSELLTATPSDSPKRDLYYNELQKTYEAALGVASEASRNGATYYALMALEYVASAALGRGEAEPPMPTRLARNCFMNFMRGSAKEQVACEVALQALMLCFAAAYGGVRTPSKHVVRFVLGMLRVAALENLQTESAVRGTVTLHWIVGLISLGSTENDEVVRLIAVNTANVMASKPGGSTADYRQAASEWIEQNLDGQLGELSSKLDSFQHLVMDKTSGSLWGHIP